MTACSRCGTSAYDTKVRSCTATNCELRGHAAPKTGATTHGVASLTPAPTDVAPVPANDSIPVHARSNAR